MSVTCHCFCLKETQVSLRRVAGIIADLELQPNQPKLNGHSNTPTPHAHQTNQTTYQCALDGPLISLLSNGDQLVSKAAASVIDKAKLHTIHHVGKASSILYTILGSGIVLVRS